MHEEHSEKDRWKSVAGSTRKIWETATVSLTLIAGAYLVLATLEPTRTFLEHYVFKLDITTIAALVAVMLEVCIVAIYQLGRDVRSMRRALEKQVSDNVIYDISEIIDRLRSAPHPHRTDSREVEILGHTLSAVWPQLSAWVMSRAQPTNWTVTLYCLAPDFVSDCGQFPATWADESQRMQDRIHEFTEAHRADLTRRNISIDVRPYSCLSVVHGYRFQDGEIFMSFMEWSRDDKVTPYLFYERLSPDDRSPRDNEYRELFNSWMRRVQRTLVAPAELSPEPRAAGLLGE